nr:IS110 family transposase [Streptomyces sp. S1D4-11]
MLSESGSSPSRSRTWKAAWPGSWNATPAAASCGGHRPGHGRHSADHDGDNPERLGREASFAALCGVSPVERSSDSRQYRRLNRGGDRQANAALHRIVQTRLCFDPRTRQYYERRIAEGKTRCEIVRCLIGEVLMLRPNPWVVTPSVGVGGRPRCRAALDGQFEFCRP